MRLKAYGTLKNSGVVTTNQKGEVTIYLDCPQIYMNDDGKVYHRHFHFLYWDENKNTWDKNLYTQKIICDVDKKFVKKYLQSNQFNTARNAAFNELVSCKKEN